RRFAIAIAANATLLALFSIVQQLTWNGKIFWTFPAPFKDAGPFVSHNHLSAYLNMGFGFALGFLMARGRSMELGKRLWAGYAASAMAVGIVASHSRTGFLAMMVALVVALVIRRPKGFVLVGFLASALVLVPVLLVAVGGSGAYKERLATILDKSSYMDRFEV